MGNVEASILTRASFEALLGSFVKYRPDKRVAAVAAAKAAEEMVAAPGSTESKYAGSEYRYEDLEIMQTLGMGTFGRVRLVKHRPTGAALALKMLRKTQIVEYKQTKSVMNEKAILSEIRHPFVC